MIGPIFGLKTYSSSCRWREDTKDQINSDGESILEYDLEESQTSSQEILTIAAKQKIFDDSNEIKQCDAKDGCDNLAVELEERLEN